MRSGSWSFSVHDRAGTSSYGDRVKEHVTSNGSTITVVRRSRALLPVLVTSRERLELRQVEGMLVLAERHVSMRAAGIPVIREHRSCEPPPPWLLLETGSRSSAWTEAEEECEAVLQVERSPKSLIGTEEVSITSPQSSERRRDEFVFDLDVGWFVERSVTGRLTIRLPVGEKIVDTDYTLRLESP